MTITQTWHCDELDCDAQARVPDETGGWFTFPDDGDSKTGDYHICPAHAPYAVQCGVALKDGRYIPKRNVV